MKPLPVLPRAQQLIVIVVVTACLLLVPLIAMQLSDEVQWGAFDFIIMGALIFGTGLLVDRVRRSTSKYKVAAIIGIILVVFWIWAELAVGVVTRLGS